MVGSAASKTLGQLPASMMLVVTVASLRSGSSRLSENLRPRPSAEMRRNRGPGVVDPYARRFKFRVCADVSRTASPDAGYHEPTRGDTTAELERPRRDRAADRDGDAAAGRRRGL